MGITRYAVTNAFSHFKNYKIQDRRIPNYRRLPSKQWKLLLNGDRKGEVPVLELSQHLNFKQQDHGRRSKKQSCNSNSNENSFENLQDYFWTVGWKSENSINKNIRVSMKSPHGKGKLRWRRLNNSHRNSGTIQSSATQQHYCFRSFLKKASINGH